MASARDILDERLARGEITVDEHAKLAAQISQQGSAPERNAAAPQPTGAPATPPAQPSMGKTLWNGMGIVVALAWIGLTNSVVDDLISSCVQRGNPQSFCQTSGVNWTMVYGSYAIALAVGASSAFALFKHKLSGFGAMPPR